MRAYMILLVLLLFIGDINSQSRSFTLEEAIAYGLENHTEIRRGQLKILDAQQQIYQNRAIGLPTLEANFNYTRNLYLPVSLVPAQFIDDDAMEGEFAELQFGTKNNMLGALDLNTLLFDANYLVALRASRKFKEFTEKEFEQIQTNVTNNIVDAYLPNLIIQENIQILSKNIDNLQNLYRETSALYKGGFVEKLDVDRLELSLSNLKAEMTNLEQRQVQTKLVLKYQMGLQANTEIEFSDNLENLLERYANLRVHTDQLHLGRSEYRVSELGVSLAELNVQSKKTAFLPSVRAFVNLQEIGQGDNLRSAIWNPTSAAGISINVPIFSGLGKKADLERAKLDLEIQKIQQQQLIDGINLEITNAQNEVNTALNNLAERNKNLVLAERIYRTTQIKYREGVGSSIEINQAEQSLYQAQQNHLLAKYDLLKARLDLNTALGI
ncbi:MAG: TolC family protein [Bacteroidia bacterium]|nr:TolC family protein [Bacteroidia bacterium]